MFGYRDTRTREHIVTYTRVYRDTRTLVYPGKRTRRYRDTRTHAHTRTRKYIMTHPRTRVYRDTRTHASTSYRVTHAHTRVSAARIHPNVPVVTNSLSCLRYGIETWPGFFFNCCLPFTDNLLWIVVALASVCGTLLLVLLVLLICYCRRR